MESYALTLTNLSRIVSLNKVNEKKPEMGPLKSNGSINIAWTFPNGVIFILDIKSQFPDIDKKIKINVTKKLNELYGY